MTNLFKNIFFLVLTLEFKLTGIFIITFVISSSKYVGLVFENISQKILFAKRVILYTWIDFDFATWFTRNMYLHGLKDF